MSLLALLDGHSLAYRAFYALPETLATASGQVTNAVYGFTSMLIKLLDDHSPDGLAVAWDAGRATFRTESFPEYKAQRSATPDSFRSQLPLIQEVLEAMGVTQVEMPNYEADDVIATLARRAEADGWRVLVVTGDRDSFQLVSERVNVLYTRRGITDTVRADATWIEDKYGVRPDQYLEYAALRGDASDNLPGVPGVGEKTASRLVSAYGDVEAVFARLQEEKPKLRESLVEHRERVFVNRRLMALVDDLDLNLAPGDLVRNLPDRESLKPVFDRLEFATLWERLGELEDGMSAPAAGRNIAVQVRKLREAGQVRELADRPGLAVEPVRDGGRLAGLAAAPDGPEEEGAQTVFFIPAQLLGELAPALSDPDFQLSAHGAKGLVRDLWEAGAGKRAGAGLAFDSELAAYLINPASRRIALEDLASGRLGLELAAAGPEDEGGDPDSQTALDFTIGPDLEGAARRAVAVRRLRAGMEAELAERDQSGLLAEMELPLVPVLARMEQTGIRVDRPYLERLGDSLRDELAVLEKEIYEAAGGPFKINSTLQLRKVLFDDLQLPVLKKTPKGAPSTDATVLAKLEGTHPVVGKLLGFREREKLRSTYVDGYLPLIGPDGRIHAHFNQTAAATGRLSSDHPNLQNIPVRSERGRTIRRAFIPREGWRFVVADYSQIELRILAHLSGDRGLLAAFAAGEDIHAATAAGVFDVPMEAVTPELRRRAKGINFGLLYGMESFGLAERLEISREEASGHMDDYFDQFPQVRDFLDRMVEDARRTGYTTTIRGRRRYLPELSADDYRVRQMGERMALNAPIQGSAADIIKLAMVELDRRLPEVEAALLLQVHDELVLEASPEAASETAALVAEVMEGVESLEVPLTVEIATGSDLASVKG